ncbi:ATP-dependent DNA ligase [Mycetocola zhujimingii]|uniref:ATP-dependent DNA ligase n=1 Tax=Mycetocola zhujimingii TaxID=2079792 RepID=A0A2U1TD95_9MICO|nr:ATP-dependent DNA ligase [Mycetocola zhujimingii]AWB85308.1 ATP-dependent DNA ligase [Mycetocola zhujimingii]PWC06858.1 ATP-dependent DNA ligase [Mycetocola zhujimingii]
MGKFIYGTPSISVDFDDRVLAHLKVVILSKVRRGESFSFSWEYTVASGSGHSSIWIHPAIPLQFDFAGSREPRLNRAWVEQLVRLANSPAGLRVIPEPAEPAP